MHPHDRNFDPNNPYGVGEVPNTTSPQGSQPIRNFDPNIMAYDHLLANLPFMFPQQIQAQKQPLTPLSQTPPTPESVPETQPTPPESST
ncbi:hypothetical protein HanHA89_Chr13g0497451 [Helianthus annuus]|nr:hypothetical protein HanHA89_Chr13g0497451 [Helianthus annuus]